MADLGREEILYLHRAAMVGSGCAPVDETYLEQNLKQLFITRGFIERNLPVLEMAVNTALLARAGIFSIGNKRTALLAAAVMMRRLRIPVKGGWDELAVMLGPIETRRYSIDAAIKAVEGWANERAEAARR